ncbi:MAG TPA: hypothetical protein PL037_07320, partial [Elusimicrobiales bacterium]|nr:hypothetical protein [Elusimicrobiales bacterium]
AALTALLLARPYAVLYRSAPEPPRLAVLLDASVHMREGHTARGSGRTKYAEASAWLARNLPGLGASAAVECYAFSDRLYRTDCSSFTVSVPAGGYAESDLKGALSALAGDGGGASCPDRVWIFTDGLSLSGGDWPPDDFGCRDRADIISVGAVSPPRGVSVSGLSGPPFAFAHIPFQISGSVRVSGLKGSPLRLKLMDGNGAVAGTRTFQAASDDEIVTATFTVSAPSVGRADYSFCAAVGRGEGCSAVRPLAVSVIREKLRVMYLAGRPSFEYAFLRDLLKGRSGIDLVSFVILRDPEDMPATDERELSLIPFPVNEIFLRDISHFDVFIMQDFDLRRFSVSGNYISSLADFVRKGGGLAVLGGRSSFGGGGYYGMPELEAMLPAGARDLPDFSEGLEYKVFPSGHAASRLFPFQENDEGFWAGAPSLRGASLLGPLKPGARSVFYYEDPSSGGKRVFSAEREYGKGRVMEIAGTSTWRWKMLGARQTKYSGLYSAFWSRTLAYLDGSLGLEKVTLDPLPRPGPGRPFRLKVLNDDYLPPSESELVSVDAYLEAGGETVPVEFTRSGRGLYEASVQPAAPGRNR